MAFYFHLQRECNVEEIQAKKKPHIFMQGFDLFGSPGRARTADLMINSHPLYQLSYRGLNFFLNGAPREI